MSWREFERFVGRLFHALGYSVSYTSPYDDGADVIGVRGDDRVAVQAKHRSRGDVRLEAVRQVVDGRIRYDCTRGYVVTNRSFNRQAIRAADAHGVELWDRSTLLTFLSPTARTSVPMEPDERTPAPRPQRTRNARREARSARPPRPAVGSRQQRGGRGYALLRLCLGLGALFGFLHAAQDARIAHCPAGSTPDCSTEAAGNYVASLAVPALVGAAIGLAVALALILVYRSVARLVRLA